MQLVTAGWVNLRTHPGPLVGKATDLDSYSGTTAVAVNAILLDCSDAWKDGPVPGPLLRNLEGRTISWTTVPLFTRGWKGEPFPGPLISELEGRTFSGASSITAGRAKPFPERNIASPMQARRVH
jgi:hypothetical protein